MNSILIQSQAEFDQHFSVLASEPLLAVDTEFFRETTYFPHLGLVQIANSKIIANIDPLAFDAKDAIASLLLNPDITKVFHACSQDLEVLYLYLGELPCPILDTQIAASLINDTEQIGYANLVLSELNIQLDKSQTRTNWLKRPLSDKQLQYAADDVDYLFKMIPILLNKLEKLNRKHWFFEDCELLCALPHNYNPDISHGGRRVKGTHKLPGLDLAIINAIANWREQLAIKKDKTRRRVMADDIIVSIAENKPESQNKLCEIALISKLFNPEETQSLFEAVQTSYRIPENEWPVNHRKKLNPEEKQKLDKLHQLISKKATTLAISSTVLCARKELTSLFNGDRSCRVLTGWRSHEIGAELLMILESR